MFERGLRLAMLTLVTPFAADVGAKSFLDGLSEFQKGKPLEGTTILSITLIATFCTGYSASFAIWGHEFTQNLLQTPSRFR